MKDETRLVRQKICHTDADPVATPIFQTSAFRSGDPYFYSRNSNPNFVEVEEIICALDGGSQAVLYGSGMAAISAVLHLLRPGDRLIVNHLIYGCSFRFIADYCEHFGISVDFVDLSRRETVVEALDESVSMVLFETPTNPFLKTVDIALVAGRLHAANPAGLVVVDNTWATPLYQKPLAHGADIVVYSNSKFFGGHSDIISGTAVAAAKAVAARLASHRFYAGTQPDPFAAWLLRRSLQTLAVRLERHAATTEMVASHLRSHPAIARVYLPEIDGRQLTGYAGLLFLRLATPRTEAVESFVASLELFDRGTPMASVASAVAVPYHGSHLSMTPAEKAAIGLDEHLVRLSLGLEDGGDLIGDLEQALAAAECADEAA